MPVTKLNGVVPYPQTTGTLAQMSLIPPPSCVTTWVWKGRSDFNPPFPPAPAEHQTTGVTVNDEAVEMFNAFKLHRAPHDNRYFIYKIENDAEIIVDTFGDKTKTYDDFTACLPPNECRYGVFDLDFTTRDGREANKLIFISWSPDTAKIKNKMVYAASKEAIKSALMGIGIHLQATDQGELELDYIKSQVQKV
ncbi:unnamed protein product [Ectocarpus sp. 4 AP-2014]